eukprot:gene1751-33160_t
MSIGCMFMSLPIVSSLVSSVAGMVSDLSMKFFVKYEQISSGMLSAWALLLLILPSCVEAATTHSWLDASQVGVSHCRLDLNGPALSPSLNSTATFSLHIFVKLTLGGGKLRFKGFTTVCNPHLSEDALPDITIDPMLSLRQEGGSWEVGRGSRAGKSGGSWEVSLPTTSLLHQSTTQKTNIVGALTRPLNGLLEGLPEGLGNMGDILLSSKASSNTCVLKALSEEDPRGKHIQPNLHDSQAPANATIIMHPLYNLSSNVDAMAALLDKHIQFHRAMGFQHHMLYVRPGDMEAVSSHARLSKWIHNGHLLLYLWKEVPFFSERPYFDQRIVYNHALLAFSSQKVYLAMIDIDEYLCSPDGQPTAIKVQRYHTVVSNWNRTQPELPIWLPETPLKNHPILRYNVINTRRQPEVKSIVRPEYIRTFFIHHASSFSKFNTTRAASADAACMRLVHLKNLFKSRDTRK